MAISYTGSPFLSTMALQKAIVTNTVLIPGTIYTSSTGLIIDSITGDIDLVNSTAGTYTITYGTETTTITLAHSFSDIKDLYNQVLLLDKTYVDVCVAEIKAEIMLRVNSIDEPFFYYNCFPVIGALEVLQQDRIKDQITFQLRNLGIRVNLPPYIVASLNYPATVPIPTDVEFYKIGISWEIREKREYMKNYV